MKTSGSPGSPTRKEPIVSRSGLDDLCVALAMGEHASLVHAGLAVVGHRVRRQRGNHGVEVGVGQHDRGRLAAELEAAALDLRAAQRCDAATGARAAREADLSTSGCSTNASLTLRPAATMLSTPAGSPASAKTSASRKPNSGVSSGGLRTTLHPASSAGASFGNDSPSGKFHGTMAPTTPTATHQQWPLDPLALLLPRGRSTPAVESPQDYGASHLTLYLVFG